MSRFGVGGISPLWEAGFTSNPFRALSETEWETMSILPETIREAVEDPSRPHIQILGQPGRGKSSVLKAILLIAGQKNAFVSYEYVPAGAEAFLTQVPTGWWFCLDEAQRLNTSQRDRLVRLASEKQLRLIFSSHEDLSPLFNHAGQDLISFHLDNLDMEHYEAVLQRRIRFFVRSGAEHARLESDAVTALFARFGTDLRSTERFLYDYFQNKVSSPVSLHADDLAF